MTLRIQRSVESELVVFKMTGRIQSEDVSALLTLMSSESQRSEIVIDLEQVRLVDREAVLFLAQREAAGARLRNCSAYIREWINQESNAMRKSETEGTDDFAE